VARSAAELRKALDQQYMLPHPARFAAFIVQSDTFAADGPRSRSHRRLRSASMSTP